MDENFYLSLLLNFIITAFCYMIVPILLKIFWKKYDDNAALAICVLNSGLVCMAFFLFREFNGIEHSKTFLAPAFFYYLINRGFILKDPSKKKTKERENNPN